MSSIWLKIHSFWEGLDKRVVQIAALVLLLGFVGVLIYFFHDRESLERFTEWGYPGVFLVTLISSTTVIFPVPGEIVVWWVGGLLPFYWVGLVASIGGALGESTGYLAGYWGQGISGMKQRQMYQKAERWMKRYGSIAIFVIALLPLKPIPFDVAGIAAGALRFPFWKFLLACWAGRLPRGILVAYLGSISAESFLRWLS